tara:strand:- start:415 stop:693 length:279 start_codon:yes stop_codon:yes gene_type:complete
MKVFKVEQSIKTYRRKYQKKSDKNGEPTARKRGLAFKPAVKQSVKRHFVKSKTEPKEGKEGKETKEPKEPKKKFDYFFARTSFRYMSEYYKF